MVKPVGGVEVPVHITGFANDLTTFRGKDDVLTLMIHLGYLSYHSERKTVRIPHEEIRLEFQRLIHEVKHEETLKRLAQSEQLFTDTIREKEDAVAACIEKVHAEEIYDSDWPALVVELKWNQSAEGAIEQILKKKYPDVLKNIGRPILLVGITYEKDASSGEKKHKCRIMKI